MPLGNPFGDDDTTTTTASGSSGTYVQVKMDDGSIWMVNNKNPSDRYQIQGPAANPVTISREAQLLADYYLAQYNSGTSGYGAPNGVNMNRYDLALAIQQAMAGGGPSPGLQSWANNPQNLLDADKYFKDKQSTPAGKTIKSTYWVDNPDGSSQLYVMYDDGTTAKATGEGSYRAPGEEKPSYDIRNGPNGSVIGINKADPTDVITIVPPQSSGGVSGSRTGGSSGGGGGGGGSTNTYSSTSDIGPVQAGIQRQQMENEMKIQLMRLGLDEREAGERAKQFAASLGETQAQFGATFGLNQNRLGLDAAQAFTDAISSANPLAATALYVAGGGNFNDPLRAGQTAITGDMLENAANLGNLARANLGIRPTYTPTAYTPGMQPPPAPPAPPPTAPPPAPPPTNNTGGLGGLLGGLLGGGQTGGGLLGGDLLSGLFGKRFQQQDPNNPQQSGGQWPRFAHGGMTNAPMAIVGDSTGANPAAGGARPELMMNPTGAPIGIAPMNDRTMRAARALMAATQVGIPRYAWGTQNPQQNRNFWPTGGISGAFGTFFNRQIPYGDDNRTFSLTDGPDNPASSTSQGPDTVASSTNAPPDTAASSTSYSPPAAPVMPPPQTASPPATPPVVTSAPAPVGIPDLTPEDIAALRANAYIPADWEATNLALSRAPRFVQEVWAMGQQGRTGIPASAWMEEIQRLRPAGAYRGQLGIRY